MKLLINKIGERLSGIIGDEKYNVPFTKELYNALKNREAAFNEAETIEEVAQIISETLPLIQTKVSEIITTDCPNLVFNNNTNKYYLKNRGVVSSHPVPKPLVDWIIESIDKGVDYQPVIMAWVRFLRNPKFTSAKAERFARYLTTTVVDHVEKERLIKEEGLSADVATERSTYRDVSLTKTGMLSTYKACQIKFNKFDVTTGKAVDRYEKVYDEETGSVTVKLPSWAEDFCLIPPVMGEGGDPVLLSSGIKAHRIVVGSIHALDWNQVDCNDQYSCVKGLHLGGLTYIKGYQGEDTLTVNCFVDPANIGAFTDNGSGAIRCREYFVHSAVFAPNKALYRESEYEAHTAKEWDALRTEAIKLSEEKKAKIDAEVNELRAL